MADESDDFDADAGLRVTLLPCPFCGSANVGVGVQPLTTILYACCRECRAKGPERNHHQAAADAWNAVGRNGQQPSSESIKWEELARFAVEVSKEARRERDEARAEVERIKAASKAREKMLRDAGFEESAASDAAWLRRRL